MATNAELQKRVEELSREVDALRRVLVEIAAAVSASGYMSPAAQVAIRKAGLSG